MKILVVEDNDSSVILLTIQLNKILKDVEIMISESGEGAIELYKKHMNDIILVITDIRIAGNIDGYGVTKSIIEIKKIPIIILTGECQIDKDFESYDNIHFLRKPYESDDIKKILNKINISYN